VKAIKDDSATRPSSQSLKHETTEQKPSSRIKSVTVVKKKLN